jgi:hypothetical protein
MPPHGGAAIAETAYPKPEHATIPSSMAASNPPVKDELLEFTKDARISISPSPPVG